MSAISGKNAVIYLATSTSANAGAIAQQTDYTIELDQGIEDVSCLGSTWATHVLSGSRKWTASLKGNFDNGANALWTAASAQAPVRFYLYPQGALATTLYYYGTGWVKLGTVIAGGNSAAPKTAVNITGDGALSVT